MSQESIAALKATGVECGIACPVGARHIFDMFPSEEGTAVKEGYKFLWRQFGLWDDGGEGYGEGIHSVAVM